MNLNDWDGAPDWDSLIYGDLKDYRTEYRDVNYSPAVAGTQSTQYRPPVAPVPVKPVTIQLDPRRPSAVAPTSKLAPPPIVSGGGGGGGGGGPQEEAPAEKPAEVPEAIKPVPDKNKVALIVGAIILTYFIIK